MLFEHLKQDQEQTNNKEGQACRPWPHPAEQPHHIALAGRSFLWDLWVFEEGTSKSESQSFDRS